MGRMDGPGAQEPPPHSLPLTLLHKICIFCSSPYTLCPLFFLLYNGLVTTSHGSVSHCFLSSRLLWASLLRCSSFLTSHVPKWCFSGWKGTQVLPICKFTFIFMNHGHALWRRAATIGRPCTCHEVILIPATPLPVGTVISSSVLNGGSKRLAIHVSSA